jgi:hypothetical protein
MCPADLCLAFCVWAIIPLTELQALVLGCRLTNQDVNTRTRAARELRELWPRARLACQPLIVALANVDRDVKIASFEALQRMGKEPPNNRFQEFS